MNFSIYATLMASRSYFVKIVTFRLEQLIKGIKGNFEVHKPPGYDPEEVKKIYVIPAYLYPSYI